MRAVSGEWQARKRRWVITTHKVDEIIRVDAPSHEAFEALTNLFDDIDDDLNSLREVMRGIDSLLDKSKPGDARGVSQCRLCVSQLFKLINENLLKCGWFLLGDALTVVHKFLDILVTLDEEDADDFVEQLDEKCSISCIIFRYYQILRIVGLNDIKESQGGALRASVKLLEKLCRGQGIWLHASYLFAIVHLRKQLQEHNNYSDICKFLNDLEASFFECVQTNSNYATQTLFGVRFHITTTEHKTHTTRKDAMPDRPEIFKDAQVVAYTKYGRVAFNFGEKISRRRLVLHPYTGASVQEGNNWTIERALRFVAMWPDEISAARVKSKVQLDKRKHKWNLFERGIKFGEISCDSNFESFAIALRYAQASLLGNSFYHDSIHFLKMNTMKEKSTVSKQLRKYLTRYAPNSLLSLGNLKVPHITMSVGSVVDVLESYRGSKVVTFGRDDELVSLCWVAPWATSFIDKMSYFMIDASFFALRPYVYCVPHGVCCNTSIPLGLSVYGSEKVELYQLFLDCLPQHSRDTLVKKVCITDDGTAIRSFLEAHKIRQVLCHRHLIESFGTNGIGGSIIRIILKSADEQDFVKKRNYCNEIILEFEKAGNTFQKLAKYLQLTCQTRDTDGSFVDLDKRDYLQKWALWLRDSVTSTTNHQESFHRTINAAVRSRTRKFGFIRSLHTLLSKACEKRAKWQSYAGRNLDEAFRKVQQAKTEGTETQCSCRGSLETARRWEIEAIPFPCVHVRSNIRNQMFRSFKEAVVERLASVDAGIEDSLENKITVVKNETLCPVHEPIPLSRLSLDKKDDTISKKEAKILNQNEKRAIKIGNEIFPSLSVRLHRESVISVCRTVIEENSTESAASQFVKCYIEIGRRLKQK